uniref:Macaca fascicularis brain cDNA clone: QflA-19975, similar to human baculoviral IAP repeat-containing 4 (BIRC4), mRNA, RefSeq: NM_001167.2 n=1 Tax=Macaca fascicularis TaxID=9541 RepID=I7GN93_MACFA|nr:unnamed protein product [Macaca fascicularis]
MNSHPNTLLPLCGFVLTWKLGLKLRKKFVHGNSFSDVYSYFLVFLIVKI